MSLLDMILPTPAKQQQQLSQDISNQVLSVMSQSKFQAAAAITQSATITATGTSKISGVNINQTASINIGAFLSQQTNAQLQSDLKDALTNTITNDSSNMPFGKEPNVNTTISNIVNHSITSNFSVENMSQLNNAINQSVNITAVDAATLANIQIAQKADLITKFSNQVGTDIATKLMGSYTSNSGTTTKTSNFISDTIGAVGGAISSVIGAGAMAIFAGPAMLFIMLIVVVLIAVWIVRGGGSHELPPPPQMEYVSTPAMPAAYSTGLPPVGGF
jgi:hypothetical protein